VALTYFQADKKKAGGTYVSVTGQLNQLKMLNDFKGVLILAERADLN